jgi:hypothetical protein
MLRQRIFIIIGVIALIVFLMIGAGCFRSEQDKPVGLLSSGDIENVPFSPFNDYVLSDERPAEAPEDLAPVPEDPSPKQGEQASASQNVIVSSVVPDQELKNPFVILGRARAFENTINWRVRDRRNTELAKGYAMTNAADVGKYGSFRIRAFFNGLPDIETGHVEVFTISPRDGSEQDKVSIPVRFIMDRMPVKVFFSNIVEDPQALNCGTVYPITRRVVQTQNVAEAALLELLKGPTSAEQGTGSRTSIIPGTALRSVSIVNSVATADFSRELVFAVSGSCNVQALVGQVNETLKQFPSVEVVKIYVEGKDAELELQP